MTNRNEKQSLLRQVKKNDLPLLTDFVQQLYREDQQIEINPEYPKRTLEEFQFHSKIDPSHSSL